MSDKILLVLERILREPEKVTNIQKSPTADEYYFEFMDRVMSIQKFSGEFRFYLYTGHLGIDRIMHQYESLNSGDEEPEAICYTDTDFEVSPKNNPFKALYRYLEEKHLGVDQILDDLLR